MNWADMLEQLPTLATGQAEDLKLETEPRELPPCNALRVWLTRSPDGLADGHPFKRTVYVEQLVEGRWLDVGYFDGDEDEPHPFGMLGEAYAATKETIG